AVLATALAGAMTTACAVLAGLGHNYTAPPDDAPSEESASADSGPGESSVDAPSIDDAHYAVDAADATAPGCGLFTCPDAATFCDDFHLGIGNWTPFGSIVTVHYDDVVGCGPPSLQATSTADEDYGVQKDFNNAPNKLVLELDVRIDTLNPTDE